MARRDPLSGVQKRTLISLLEKNGRLRAGKFANDFTLKDAQNEWQKITNYLNAIPGGAKKDWKAWRKTWQDMKKHATTKHTTQKKEYNKTGGGSPVTIKISNDDQMILDMISKKKLNGLDNVEETEVTFDFEDDLIMTPKMSKIAEPKIQQKTSKIAEPENQLKTSKIAEPESQPGCSGITFNMFNTPTKSDINVVEVEEDNYVTSGDEEHGYSLKYPDENHPKKRLSKTRRLESSVKVSQQMLQNFGQKNEIIENYYNKKIDFFEHKKAHDEKILKAIHDKNSINRDNNQLIAEILKAVSKKN